MEIIDTHRVAIVTRFLGPTNFRCARIIADAGLGRKVTVPYAIIAFQHLRLMPALRAPCAINSNGAVIW